MVALSAESDQHMKDLELMARNLRLPCQMIEIFVVSFIKQLDQSLHLTVLISRKVTQGKLC